MERLYTLCGQVQYFIGLKQTSFLSSLAFIKAKLWLCLGSISTLAFKISKGCSRSLILRSYLKLYCIWLSPELNSLLFTYQWNVYISILTTISLSKYTTNLSLTLSLLSFVPFLLSLLSRPSAQLFVFFYSSSSHFKCSKNDLA